MIKEFLELAKVNIVGLSLICLATVTFQLDYQLKTDYQDGENSKARKRGGDL